MIDTLAVPRAASAMRSMRITQTQRHHRSCSRIFFWQAKAAIKTADQHSNK